MQQEVRLVVDIEAPLPVVWDGLVTWERHGEWMPLTTVRHAGGPRAAVGTRISGRTGIGPLAVTDTMTVTAIEEPTRIEVVHTGRVVKGVGAFVLEPLDGGRTRFVWWERVEVPGGPFARLVWLVGGPLTRLTFGWGLRRARDLAEADARRAA